MKLWQKSIKLNERVEAFTVGDDYLLDQELLPYDIIASKAHVRMLAKIKILLPEEATTLLQALDKLFDYTKSGQFKINPEDEDSHTAIENFLVSETGKMGEKVHTGRSRNDQVLTAIRLYSKAKLSECEKAVYAVIRAIDCFAEKYGCIKLPGYSHMRKAMPITVSMWAGAFRDALADDQMLLYAAMKLVDQNPLGTGAGFGISLPLDRQMTTEDMGFAKILANPMYAQNSRGKFEGFVLTVLSNIMMDLNRLSSDVLFFSMPEFGFFTLPDEFLTGSSIMPHKKNPDVLEILRGKYHQVMAMEWQVRNTTINLISGYQRDLQLTKGALMNGFAHTIECLQIAELLFNNLSVNVEQCQEALTPELFSVDRVYQLMQEGLTFREAYRRIGAEYDGEKKHE